MGDDVPRRFRRRQDDPERAHDMAELVKKLRARKKRRMRKHAHEGEVARIFKGQRFGDEDVKMGPRNEGWQVIKEESSTTPSGMVIEKTTRIRRFGRMKKTAFIKGFFDELEKAGVEAAKMLIEPTPKKSPVLEKNPFLRLEAKRKLVAGKRRTKTIPKVKGLMSGSAQFLHRTGKKEAS
jgi:hypothetical protein